MQKCKNCSHVCAYHCAQLLYTTQHRTVLIIFPLILQTSTRAQMLSIGGEEASIKCTLPPNCESVAKRKSFSSCHCNL